MAAVVEGCSGSVIQIFNDDIVAFTRLTDLLLISTIFPYLCDCWFGDA
jgi:hypothetical protein